MSTTPQELLAAGAEAYSSGDLDAAHDALTKAVEMGDLPEARLLLGVIAFRHENFTEIKDHWERAFRAFSEADNLRGAASAATMLGMLHYDAFGNESASRGWLSRAGRLLDRVGRCVERGYLELALVACDIRSASALEESAAVALDLAIEFHDADLEARALADGGLALISQGRLAQGFARLDEAMAPISAGEVHNPMIAGTVFCALLTACERTGELRRAEEWTRACREFGATAWGGKLPVMYSHCRIAYGTVLCDAGRWPEAETELLAACGPESSKSVPKLADSAGALANLRILQGRLEEATELLAPYTDRFEVCEPLARLHFVRGELDLASAVIGRALAELVGDRLRAGRLLMLLVDIELARGDLEAADGTAERLADYAEASDSPVLRAGARLADGRIAVARGDTKAAIAAFEQGVDELRAEERPILTAALRLELAHVRADVGDHAAAADETRAAHAIFARVGAERHVERADALLERLGSSAPAAT